jgi:uncharacterized membrane protein YbhN (UPF0104 family)
MESPPARSGSVPALGTEPVSRRYSLRSWALGLLLLLGLVLVASRAPGEMLLDVLVRASSGWTAAAVAASMVPVLAMSTALMAATARPLPLGRTAVVQLATSFANALTPAGAGGVALNVRFLQRRGTPVAESVAVVGLVQLTSVLTTVGAMTLLLLGTGQVTATLLRLSPGGLALVLVAVVAVAGPLGAWPAPRARARAWVLAPLREAWPRLRETLRSPARLAGLTASHLAVTGGLAATLWCCLRAFDVQLPLTGLLLALLAGSAVAAAAPVPGGVGAVEAATTAAVVAAGAPAALALPAVLLFRLLTFWLRVPLGWLCLVLLRRGGAV